MSTPQMYTTLIVDNPPKPGQLYRVGWNAYCEGTQYETLTNEHERRGWKAAHRAETGDTERQGW